MLNMLNLTGQQLRDRREAAGIKAFELAERMHVHSSRVSQIEALAAVSDRTAKRYLDALNGELTTSREKTA